jgi:murein L,D-transpeptidase YafK
MRKTVKWSLKLFVLSLFCIVVYYFYPEKRLPDSQKIDFLKVVKSKSKMYAYFKDSQVKTYTVSFGEHPIGHKEYQGDEKTPEGTYTIFNKNPHSVCYKNLGISYPNDADRVAAKKLGKPVGGDIKIHGLPNGQGSLGKFHRWKNWTNGCIAVTNKEMEELYNQVIIGSLIEILP